MAHLSYVRVHLLYVGLISLSLSAINAYELPLERGTATQSSTAKDADGRLYPASRATDGVWAGPPPDYNLTACTHTLNEAKAWWKIRMDKVYVVRSVTIYNTFTAPNRMQRLNITVGMAPELTRQSLCKYYHSTVPAAGNATIVCTQELTGLYIGIQKTSRTTYNPNGSIKKQNDGYLTLCEVKASGYEVCSGNFFGLGCNTACKCQEKCDDENGACPGGRCESGYTGVNCQQRSPCNHPGKVEHATASVTSHLDTVKVKYTCVLGYQIESGDVERTCQPSKLWNGRQPTCGRIKCGHPGDVQHATVSGSHRYKDTVTYTCAPGYEIQSGDAQRICQSSKRWSGQQPTCATVSCVEPATPRGAIKIGTNYFINGKLHYICEKGFERIGGDVIRICQATKTWSGSPIVCNPHIQYIGIERYIGSVFGSFIAGFALCFLVFLITYLVRRRQTRPKEHSTKTSGNNGKRRKNSKSQAEEGTDLGQECNLQAINSSNAGHVAEEQHVKEAGRHIYEKLDAEALSLAMYQNVSNESSQTPMYEIVSE